MHHYVDLAQNNKHLNCYFHSALILNSFSIILFVFTEFHARDLSERNSLYGNLNKFYYTDFIVAHFQPFLALVSYLCLFYL